MRRSEALDLTKYDTDKIGNDYLRWYDELIGDAWPRVESVLEIGVHRGGSLALWRDYFPNARIAGVDVDLSKCVVPAGVELFQGSQNDAAFLHDVARRVAPNGFDLIVDDASHIGSLTESTFRALYDAHLKAGGLYVIEDWATGYLDDWPDGKRVRDRAPLVHSLRRRLGMKTPIHSHEYGVVGFVKQLIDRYATSAKITITPGLVAIRKSR